MRMFARENGYYYVEIERNKVRSLHTKDEALAKELFLEVERQWLEDRIAGLGNKRKVSLEKFIATYAEDRELEIDDDTLRMDKLALNKLADIIGTDFQIGNIDKGHIKSYKKVYAPQIKAVSLNTYLRHLKAAFNWAVAEGYLSKAPAITFVKTRKALPKIIPPDDLETIVAYAQENNAEMWRIIYFNMYTGCRLSEIKNLCHQHINGKWARIIGKGDKERSIPLVVQALEAIGDVKTKGPVFRQWHEDTISKKFKAIVRACGFPTYHFHMLRHSAATQMLASKIDLPTIQRILGHADIKTTQIYAKVLDEMAERQIQDLKY